ncbi:hypothetical protein [Thermomonas flagellata]|uniref:hypothetical protein n=1 Tax=Thermomonas flagellata TaxID=2888524 RepID=UPI001F047215|nr:hypothetical protein [Thermomonas flagellata]
MRPTVLLLLAPLALAACQPKTPDAAPAAAAPSAPAPTAPAAPAAPSAPASSAATAWPSSLVVVGDGYPNAGDPCRRIGESADTADLLDDAADLVGCPGGAQAPAVLALVEGHGGRVVKQYEDVTLVSVPRR